MSRIGNLPVQLPKGVTVTVAGGAMAAKGPKGQLSRPVPSHVEIAVEAERVVITRVNDSKPARARHGLTRALLQNLVTGVSTGFERRLEIVGVGYKAVEKGPILELHLGYSHPIEYVIPEGLQAKVERNFIVVSGIDKEIVGETAAKIRSFRPPEPYKGKGIRFAGETIRTKVGKAGVA